MSSERIVSPNTPSPPHTPNTHIAIPEVFKSKNCIATLCSQFYFIEFKEIIAIQLNVPFPFPFHHASSSLANREDTGVPQVVQGSLERAGEQRQPRMKRSALRRAKELSRKRHSSHAIASS
jgi:hypothetical protein